jgi:hypothetical protein
MGPLSQSALEGKFATQGFVGERTLLQGVEALFFSEVLLLRMEVSKRAGKLRALGASFRQHNFFL